MCVCQSGCVYVRVCMCGEENRDFIHILLMKLEWLICATPPRDMQLRLWRLHADLRSPVGQRRWQWRRREFDF